MMNNLESFPVFSSISERELYSKMKVSRFDSLANITQKDENSIYSDGMAMRMVAMMSG
ncbi:MAG TPA: hypothetical protein V6D50_08195 [Chroococcales cyanobacterium]|jgi:hypothetical protein